MRECRVRPGTRGTPAALFFCSLAGAPIAVRAPVGCGAGAHKGLQPGPTSGVQLLAGRGRLWGPICTRAVVLVERWLLEGTLGSTL